MPIIMNTGCSSESSSNNEIAYISANVDSGYEKTFKDLNLGILFDFDLRLPNADKSWVDIWVEGYSSGEPVDPFPLTELSYGLSPNKVEEGHMGFGIINPNGDVTQLFLYSSGIRTNPHSIDNLLKKSALSGWEYAIGSETLVLNSGEEVVLAVYRQGEGSIKMGYNYQDFDSVNEMINKDITVLLLKIKVERRDRL